MTSGADLFVVCKQCGSEVSPYITECPYCGHRLRRRAPKLPRENVPGRSPRGLSRRLSRRLHRPIFDRSTPSRSRPSLSRSRRALESRADAPPYATILLVAASCVAWVAWRGDYVSFEELAITGPLHGDWWKLFTSQFVYENGLYEFVTLVAVALFGWLLERRHGPLVVLALFLASGVAGALVAEAANSYHAVNLGNGIVLRTYSAISGGNGAALGLLAAWAIPDLKAARASFYYEGDLLGAGAIAAVILAMPLALAEVSWQAGVTGGALGLLLGFVLHRVEKPEL
jgi:membrane associated rhomboid family serine protease